MKTKARFYADKAPIINKPGRFVVIRQWSENRALNTDTNYGNGFDESEAIALVNQHNGLNRPNPNAGIVPCHPQGRYSGTVHNPK